MKKVISILVIVAMLAAFMMPSAFATEGDAAQIIVSGAEVQPGEEVKLTVSLKNNPGITNGKVVVTFDAEALELVAFDFENECTWRGLIDGNVKNGEVAFATTADTTKDHVLFEVVLKVKDGAYGDFNVGLKIDLMKNNAEEDVVFEVVEGVVTSLCKHEGVVHMDAVAPACHFEGNIEYWFCPDCECVWQDEALTQLTNRKNVILPELGGEVVHVDAKAPTCDENGNIEYWYCEACEQVWADEARTQLTNHKNVVVPAGHNIIHMEAVEAGCHFTGNIEHWYCSVCDIVWADEALTQVTNHKNVIIPELGGEVIHVPAVAPTCSSEGNIEYWYCEDCEQFWQDEARTQLTNSKNVILPAADHTIVHIDAVAPGCHYEGNIEYWYCTVCEIVWADEALTQITNHKNVILPELGGEVKHVEAKAPTCFEEGNIEYWYCEECMQVWQDEALTQLTNIKNVILPIAEHDIIHMEAVAPGCHFTGNVEHWYCSKCDTVWADKELTQITNHKNVIIPALGGEVEYVAAVAPTCTSEGNIDYWYCEECMQVWQDEALTQLTNIKNVILPAAEHALVHIDAVEAGCHFTGNIEHWYCTECDTVWSDEALTQITNHMNVIIPELGGEVKHVEAVAPTCTSEGNIEYWYCEDCMQVWQDEARTQLTNIKNVVLPLAEHKLVHIDAVEAGCHYEGNIEHWYCTECDTVWADEALTQITNHKNVIIPELGGEVKHVEAKAPTCTSEGNIEYWYCEECEQVWQDEARTQLTNIKNVVLPLADHELVHFEAVAPGCHSNGNVEYWFCSVCEGFWTDAACTQVTNSKSVTLPATGSENVVHFEAVAPGCHSNGNVEYWFCPDCEGFWTDAAFTQVTNSKSVILPATGSENVVHMEAVAPGCHFTGNVEYWFCRDCEGFWTDAACTKVTNSKSVILPELGGEVVHVEAKAPTCTENGNIEHWYCEECEQVWQDEARTQLTNHKNVIVAALGHVFVDGVCSVCGISDPADTGDSIYVAVAAAIISMMGVVALTKKREF